MVQTRLPDDVPPPALLHSAYLDLLSTDDSEKIWTEKEAILNNPDVVYNWSWCRKCATVRREIELDRYGPR